MSADIEKLAVYDDRIIQSRPRYAVEKGALSLTNAPFAAISKTTSQHTYNIYVPSENVFVDRKLLWASDVYMQMSVAAAVPVGESIVVPGRDFSLCAMPLNSLCSTVSATINDTTVVINSQDVLKEVLRLTDYKKNRLLRTAPTMLDKYVSYNDAYGTLNNPIGGYDNATDYDNIPNGSWGGLIFTDPFGVALGTASPAYAGAAYDAVNGIPVSSNAAAATYTIYFKWRTVEPICLSPFIFADAHEYETGLFGLNNIQLIMNLQAPNRLIRSSDRAGRVIAYANVAFNTQVSAGVFQDAYVYAQFLTPALDVPLPPKSVVPYMEFPRYITAVSGSIASGAVTQIQSQTITLPSIPDLFIIYCKPTSLADTKQADWYLPLAGQADNVRNPLQVNFDNFSGLLSSHTSEQLYAMSVKNGLDMDFGAWSGRVHSAGGSYGAGLRQQGQIIPAVGGLLVLKPSQDITLQPGQAPSLVGNYTFQFNIQVKNTSDASLSGVTLYVITANSGFLETIRGSSRIIKGVLSEQDVIQASNASPMARESLHRMVGGLSFGSLANALSKAKEIYHATKPAVSMVKGMLPEEGMAGKVKGALSAVGYGASGAGRSGGRKSLAQRLM
jgi:hypothetical protein